MQCDFIRDTTSGLVVCCILDSGHGSHPHQPDHQPDKAVTQEEMTGSWRRGGQGACSYSASFFSQPGRGND